MVWVGREGEEYTADQVLDLAKQVRLRRAADTYQQQAAGAVSTGGGDSNSEFDSDYDDF